MGRKLRIKYLVYKTPSEAAFRCRKLFYTASKDINESIDEWFNRVKESVNSCDFGELSNVMLIDKFISGLSDNLTENFIEKSTLTAEESLSIAKANEFRNHEAMIKVEPISCTEDFLGVEIKSEYGEPGVFDDFFTTQDCFDNEKIEMSENVQKHKESSEDDEKEESTSSKRTGKRKNEKKKRLPVEAQQSPKQAKNVVDGGVDEKFQIIPNILLTELKGSTIDNQNRTICLDCGKVFLKRNSYLVHRKLHTGFNIHQCVKCSKPFPTRAKLSRHMAVHDDDGRKFECHLCELQFNRFGAIKIHFKARHMPQGKDVLDCTYCGRKFLSQKAFNLHIKVHEGVVAGHKCPHCDKKFDRRHRMLIHASSHSDERAYTCETCGKSFKNDKNLGTHLRVHSDERRYKCHICNQMLKSNSTFRAHLRTHTGEKPFACDLCSKTFAQRSNLLKHLRYHRKERPHACMHPLCDRAFTAAYDLKIHQSVHTGARPFKCSWCDKSFTQPSTLRLHRAKIHPEFGNNRATTQIQNDIF